MSIPSSERENPFTKPTKRSSSPQIQDRRIPRFLGRTVDGKNITKPDPLKWPDSGTVFSPTRNIEDPANEPLRVAEELGERMPTILLEWYGGRHQERHRKVLGVPTNETIKAHGAADANTSNKTVRGRVGRPRIT